MTVRLGRVLICFLLWLGIVGCTAAFWSRPLLLTGILASGSIGLLAAWRGRREWLMYACGFVLGPVGEIVAVRGGAWSYSGAAWLIPLWLAPGWGMAAVVLLKLAEAIGPEAPRR